MKDYVAPEIEVLEVLVENGYVYTSAGAFEEEGTVVTPEF